jgi:hypothetical protein
MADGKDKIIEELIAYWRRNGDHLLIPLGVGLLSLARLYARQRETEDVSAHVYVMY